MIAVGMSDYQSKNLTKTPQEIETMRKGGKILADILKQLKRMIKPGLDTWELEKKFLSLCTTHNVEPSCKGYAPYSFNVPPFPTGLCVSINDQSVHCYPKKGDILKDGDIVTIDTVIGYSGFHLDSAFCKGVGVISKERQKFVETAEKALYKAIEETANNVRTGKISHTIQSTAEKAGFNVIRDYAGHGIGKSMHENPEIPCYGNESSGQKLRTGMTICVESLFCAGDYKIQYIGSWETRMKDGKDFAQFEHTVLVKHDGYEILTKG